MRLRSSGTAFTLLAAALLAGACSSGGGGADSARNGLAALAAGDARTARVELMSAAQANPNDSGIRIALARAYLILRDGDSAQSELSRARQLGIEAAETHHLMAHAYLLQGNAEQAINEASKAPPTHSGEAARISGLAFMQIGDNERAEAAFNEAAAAAPEDAQVWTDVARFRRTSGELAGAITAADKAVGINPRSVEAIVLRGELTRSQYGLSASLTWFDRALQLDPKNVSALAERAATLADLGAMKEMLADTRAILEIAPKNPNAYYLQAMLAARAGKYELADSLYRRTQGALDDLPAAMLLAGAIEYQTGRPEQAIERLSRLVGLQPDNLKARRLLAAAQWRLGDSAATIATLRPIADRADADPYSLTLIAQAWSKQGNVRAASGYFERAADPRSRSSAALFGEPVGDSQLEALRTQAETSRGQAAIQVRLIRALLGRGLSSEALDRARELQTANPGAPEAHVLAGDAALMVGDQSAAVAAYRRAANIAFTEPVAMRLVEAMRRSGDNAGAARVLELFLQQNPQNLSAQMLAANTLLQTGHWDEAIAIYENMRARLGNRDATLLNNLAWAWSQKGDYARAIPYARRAWELDPNNPATADTFGWLLYKSGRDKARGLALIEQAGRASGGSPGGGAEGRHRVGASGG